MARLKGSFSGRELTIMEELMARGAVLSTTPGFDPERICFLVDEDEWNELSEDMQRMQRVTSDEELPLKRMFVGHIQVRKRGD